MDKTMLFLAYKSVRDTLLKFLVYVLEPQTWLPSPKKQDFGFQTGIFSRAWKWKVGLPNDFPRFFGMYFHPPDHQNIKKKFWGGSKISQK